MRSTLRPVRASALIVFLLLIACGAIPSALVATTTPAPTASATITPTIPPTQTPTKTPQALFCVAVKTPTPVAGCSIPTGEQRDRFCTKKIPYTLIAIASDVSYQVVTPNFICTDGGIHGGKRLLVCTGAQSFTFLLKVCQPGCAVSTPMQSGPTGACAPGYNYDQSNQCCAAQSTDANGCVTLKFDTRSCGG
ncbi:MAG TPA: hypothetical protein VHM28_03090 [Anaerolineales bacterium]|nr:hypothetical protein [Anaerolineales bacterium]